MNNILNSISSFNQCHVGLLCPGFYVDLDILLGESNYGKLEIYIQDFDLFLTELYPNSFLKACAEKLEFQKGSYDDNSVEQAIEYIKQHPNWININDIINEIEGA